MRHVASSSPLRSNALPLTSVVFIAQHPSNENLPVVRGQNYAPFFKVYLLCFCLPSALMKCLSHQVIKTALGKLCLMFAWANS